MYIQNVTLEIKKMFRYILYDETKTRMFKSQRSEDMSMDILSISSLFTNQNKTSTSDTLNANLGVNLSDYASLKNGSYRTMMKSYYQMQDTKNSSISTSKDSKDLLTRLKSNSDNLKDAADSLLSKKDNVFAKKEMTDESGNKTYGYDTDAIYNKVNDFVKAYNSMLDQTQNSNTTNVLSASLSSVNVTKANEKLLSTIGITVGDDNHLSIDEGTFKKSDMTTVSSLFQSTGSYGYQISAQASMIYYYADLESTKSNTYGDNAMYTYNYATGELYNTTT